MNMTLGHRVREVSSDDEKIVVEESATTGAVVIFIASAMFMLLVFRNGVGLIAAALWLLAGAYASVKSVFTVGRATRDLRVLRHFLFGTLERIYRREDIVRIFEKRTNRGSGLMIKLKSGKEKYLTMSLGFQAGELSEIARTMNDHLFR